MSDAHIHNRTRQHAVLPLLLILLAPGVADALDRQYEATLSFDTGTTSYVGDTFQQIAQRVEHNFATEQEAFDDVLLNCQATGSWVEAGAPTDTSGVILQGFKRPCIASIEISDPPITFPVDMLFTEARCAAPDRRPVFDGGWSCIEDPKAREASNAGDQCPALGNPIHPATGNKYQREEDFSLGGEFPLRWVRHYNSVATDPFLSQTRHGIGWRSDYDRRVVAITANRLELERADGNIYQYEKDTGGSWLTDANRNARTSLIETTAGGWLYTDENDMVEEYDGFGRLIHITTREGISHDLIYDTSHRLIAVRHGVYRVDGQGGAIVPQAISIDYDSNGRVWKVTDPEGHEYVYAYDSIGNLAEVTYPVPAEEPAELRRYRYAEVQHIDVGAWPSALTGIEEITGTTTTRFATFEYQSDGRATKTAHGQNADRDEVNITYGTNTATFTDAFGTSRTQAFDIKFNVAAVKNLTEGSEKCALCDGQPAAAIYDSNGYLDVDTDYNGNQTDSLFSTAGLLEQRIEAAGTAEARRTDIEWQEQGYRLPTLITVSDASGPVHQADLDYTNGKLDSIEHFDLRASSPARKTTFTYEPDSLLRTVDGPRAGGADLTTLTYDPIKRFLVSIEGPDLEAPLGGRLTTLLPVEHYDRNGRPTRIIDPNGNANSYLALSWHPRGWLASITVVEPGVDADARQRTEFRYTTYGALAAIVNTTADPDAATVFSSLALEYDAAHDLRNVQDADGNRIQITPNAYGAPDLVEFFDGASRLRTIDRVFDNFNRVDQLIAGEQQTTGFTWDNNGNLKRTSDPRWPGSETIYSENSYDALNRIRQVRDNLGNNTVLDRDVADGPTTVTAPNGAQTVHQYNGFGDMVETASPDAGTWKYTHDSAGNVATIEDPRLGSSNRILHSYDAHNRLKLIDYPSALQTDTAFQYDGCLNGRGRLCRITDESGQTDYTYHRRGMVATKTTQVDEDLDPGTALVSHLLQYEYDPADRLIQTTYPSGTVVTQDRHPTTGQIIGVTVQAGGGSSPMTTVVDSAGGADGIDYAPFGPVASIRFGNGVVSTYGLDGDYRTTTVDHVRATGTQTLISARRNNYDMADNIISIDKLLAPGGSSIGDFDYSYDPLSRLTFAERETTNWFPEKYGYEYDKNGNRLALELEDNEGDYPTHYCYRPHGGAGFPASCPAPLIGATVDNRLNHVFNQNNNPILGVQADREYAYDAAGNATLINLAPVTSIDTFIDYGDHNRPNRVVAANEVDPDGDDPLTRTEFLTTAMTHNGLGQRVRLRNTGNWEYQCNTDFGFLWCFGFPSRTLLYDEAGHIIAEHRADGVKYEYIYADDRPVAFIDYAGDQGGGAGTVYWIHTDHLGTPRYATDASANVVWSVCEHAELFNPKPCGGSVTLNLRFPGQYYLSELGMNYNYFRDYDPETGRYLQSDPIGLAGGLNTYVYASANPLRFGDRFGLQVFDLEFSFGPQVSFESKVTGAFNVSGVLNFGSINTTLSDPTNPTARQEFGGGISILAITALSMTTTRTAPLSRLVSSGRDFFFLPQEMLCGKPFEPTTVALAIDRASSSISDDPSPQAFIDNFEISLGISAFLGLKMTFRPQNVLPSSLIKPPQRF